MELNKYGYLLSIKDESYADSNLTENAQAMRKFLQQLQLIKEYKKMLFLTFTRFRTNAEVKQIFSDLLRDLRVNICSNNSMILISKIGHLGSAQ